MEYLLLTATVIPQKEQKNLSVWDSDKRFEEYREALIYYAGFLGNKLDRLIFVENSGADLDLLKGEIKNLGCEDRVAFIQFSGLDYSPEWGRGYGEVRLINYAFDHSDWLKNLHREDVVWKCTGRYKIRNLGRMIDRKPSCFHLYCDLRRYPSRWLDMRLMACSFEGYQKYLQPLEKLFSEGSVSKNPEELAYDMLAQVVERNGNIVPRFNVQPKIDGVCGFTGENYLKGRKNQLKQGVRVFCRKVFPWLWI